MGGRGMVSSGNHITADPMSFTIRTTRANVTFTNIFTDKIFKGHDEIKGSDGKIISRTYLQEMVEKRPFAAHQQKQLIQDIDHATTVTVHSGKYQDTFKIVDHATDGIVAPEEMRSFFDTSWKMGIENQVTLNMPYVALDKDTPRAGTIPFIANTEWRLLSRDARLSSDRYASQHDTFGQEKPTLSWVSGGKIRELHIKGKDTRTFLEEAGLHITLPKGPFTAAKRLSRVFRPYKHQHQFRSTRMQFTLRNGRFISLSGNQLNRENLSTIEGQEVSHFRAILQDGQTLDIQYMDQDETEAKVWDGAGVVSRDMLERTLIKPEMTPLEKTQLRREIKRMGRVEYTILTPSGQDKGHAIVADNLNTDFLLPQDTKTAVQLVNGDIFVGFSPVKAKDYLLLDEQTMINHQRFLPPEMLLSWLEEKGSRYEQGLVNGRSTLYMKEIDPDESIENLQHWPFREFIASGGNPLWSASHTKTVYNQHLNKIIEMGEHGRGKVKLPLPGGRYYVMPAAVGRRAGIERLQVGRGEIQLDKHSGTAWVNEEDWIRLQDGRDAESGIASILGGADNDDALIVIPFTDKADGQKKVLALRNPNEAGEYVILKPTAVSRTLEWETVGGEKLSYPELNSRNLTPRIDSRDKTYLGLIDPNSGPSSDATEYTIDAMETAVSRAMENAGIFQRYANFLMVAEAIGFESELPDGLETLVDAMNKTGADLRPVDIWMQAEAQKMIDLGIQVPDHLQPRTPKTVDGKRPLHTADHWIDHRQQAIQAHIDNLSQRRDSVAAAATMPNILFDKVFEHPNTIYIGAGYLKHYSGQLNQLMKLRPHGLRDEDHDFLRRVAEQYLNQYPKVLHTSILRGAMVSLQMQDESKSDAALWLSGEKQPDGSYKPGIGNKMNEALREIGLFGEPHKTESGTIIYHDPNPQKVALQTVGIRDVWFNHYRWKQGAARQPIPETKTEIPKNIRSMAKQNIAKAAQDSFKYMTLTVRERNGRFEAFTENGNLFGSLEGIEQGYVDGDTLTVEYAYAIDGNLRVIPMVRENPTDNANSEYSL